MRKNYLRTIFRKVLIPVAYGSDCEATLSTARLVAGKGQVILVGLVHMASNDPLSAAAIPARELRQKLKSYMDMSQIKIDNRVRASHNPWEEIKKIVAERKPDILLLRWPEDFHALNIPMDALIHPPCDVGIIGGQIPDKLQNVLVSIRGGPFAELAVKVASTIAKNNQASLTSLHITTPNINPRQDAPYHSLEKVLLRMPEINHLTVETEEPLTAILSTMQKHDLLVIGASARPENLPLPIGPVADCVLKEGNCAVIIVKTRRPAPASFESPTIGRSAISILVDKWFAENTFHANEFSDLEKLVSLKRKQNSFISLALPALNEEKTVGHVIQTIKEALMDRVPLVDEIVLIDSNSTDRTRDIAREMGIPVYIHQNLLPQHGARHGKGEALWKSLLVTKGDIILWIDTDIVNIHPHFVYGLIGPLLHRPEIQLVKGFYQRPLRVGDKLQAGGGGRVTELTARPLLNLFYPELSGLVQPLAGEYGGRRYALERLPFSSDYGVEIGLLIDMLEFFRVNAIAQVDLEERIHHNQTLEALSKMSFTIMQTVFRKLERRFGHGITDDENRTMKLIRYEPGRFFLDFEEINAQERPPMLEIPEYATRLEP